MAATQLQEGSSAQRLHTAISKGGVIDTYELQPKTHTLLQRLWDGRVDEVLFRCALWNAEGRTRAPVPTWDNIVMRALATVVMVISAGVIAPNWQEFLRANLLSRSGANSADEFVAAIEHCPYVLETPMIVACDSDNFYLHCLSRIVVCF